MKITCLLKLFFFFFFFGGEQQQQQQQQLPNCTHCYIVRPVSRKQSLLLQTQSLACGFHSPWTRSLSESAVKQTLGSDQHHGQRLWQNTHSRAVCFMHKNFQFLISMFCYSFPPPSTPLPPCPQSSPPLVEGWQRDTWELMNSDLSTETADSALAVGNNKNKRYPWAFVYMNIVAKALVQNINHAGNGKQISRTQRLIQMARYQLCLSEEWHRAAFYECLSLWEISCGVSDVVTPAQQLYVHVTLIMERTRYGFKCQAKKRAKRGDHLQSRITLGTTLLPALCVAMSRWHCMYCYNYC